MTSSSHLASAALIYLIGCSVIECPPTIQGVVATAAGSLLPDIDLPTSAIGRPFFPIASWINRKIGHRTLTHSLPGILLFGLLAFGIGWALRAWLSVPSAQYAWFLTLGFASHILVDTFNKTGVDLFWPARIRGVFFGNERYRIVSAGRGDYWFMTVCLVASLACYPLARDGFTFSLHQAFGDIYSVSTDFKE
ncbi:MAG: metal-dependent hydrolase [Acidobacteriota bacterium]